MNFWKAHAALRRILMIVLFIFGLALVLIGWSLTGKLFGLGLMMAGIVLMLITLLLYNKAYC